MTSGPAVRDLTTAAYARAGIERDVALTVPTFAAAAAVVASTDWVATLPKGLFDMLGPHLGLRALTAPTPIPSLAMNLAWHERTHADPAMAALRALIQRAIGGAGARRPRR